MRGSVLLMHAPSWADVVGAHGESVLVLDVDVVAVDANGGEVRRPSCEPRRRNSAAGDTGSALEVV
jgi:hypothetical protein